MSIQLDHAVSEVMTRVVETVSPTTSVRDAARLMERVDVGGLPVMAQDRVVGFVTDRDIVVRGVSHRGDLRTLNVGDVMTPRATTVREDSDIGTACDIMKKHDVRRLMVLDEDDQLVGILSLCDLAARGLGRETLAVLKTICING